LGVNLGGEGEEGGVARRGGKEVVERVTAEGGSECGGGKGMARVTTWKRRRRESGSERGDGKRVKGDDGRHE